MKRLLLIFFTLISFASFAQTGSISHSGIKLRVNDTTAYQTAVATAHAQGYSDIYWNNQATTPHWDIWNGSSYDHVHFFPWAGSSGGGSGTWGSITGTLSSQTDLQSALDGKIPLSLTGNTTISTGGNWLRLQGTGVQIPMLALDAPNNVRKSIEFRTGNVARWQIHTENNETGSGNTGTDLHFERYDDAGAFIDAPMSIGRTDGVAWFSQTPVTGVGSNPLAVTSQRIDQNNAATTSAQLATTLSDETGTGNIVYSSSPALTGTPTAPTAASGTNTTQVATTAFVMSSTPKYFPFAVTDEVTPIVTGTGKISFRMPHAMTVTACRCSLVTAQASGSIFTVDINEAGTTILSTKVTIDNTETTSTTAATAPVISDSSIADDALITIDVDQIGNGSAVGLKCTLIGY